MIIQVPVVESRRKPSAKSRISYHREDLGPVLREGRFEAFMHGCNCVCRMGAGIAAMVKEIFPEAYALDKATIAGDGKKLGTIGILEKDGRLIVNAYTQFHIHGPKPRVDYDAVRSCFKAVFPEMRKRGLSRLSIPKIGAGLAGGDWNIIEGIIHEELPEGMFVKAYYL